MKRRQNAVHVQEVKTIKKGKTYTHYYLRRSFREGGKVRKETIADLNALPVETIDLLRRSLAGEVLMAPSDHFEIVRSVPHGATAAIYGTLKRLKLEEILGSRRSRERDIVTAMIVARVLSPASKLATARSFHGETQWISLGERLELEGVTVRELYKAMDWLVERKGRIETKLGRRHLKGGGLVLYDVTAAVLDSPTCALAQIGHPKGSPKGKRQIVFGLLCNGGFLLAFLCILVL